MNRDLSAGLFTAAARLPQQQHTRLANVTRHLTDEVPLCRAQLTGSHQLRGCLFHNTFNFSQQNVNTGLLRFVASCSKLAFERGPASLAMLFSRLVQSIAAFLLPFSETARNEY
jgi:hypothetical protein